MEHTKVIEVDYIEPKDININNVNSIIDKYFFMFWDNIFPEGYDYTTLSKVVRTTTFKACMRFIYEHAFKTAPDKNNHASILNLDNVDLIKAVKDKYLTICDIYNKQLGLMGFALLAGYDVDTVKYWGDDVTGILYPVYKDIKDHLRDSSEDSLKDSDIGRIAVANNSGEVGLNYGYATALQQRAAGIPKLETIAERYGKRPQISGGDG